VQNLNFENSTVLEVFVEVFSGSFNLPFDGDFAVILTVRVSIEIEAYVFLLAPKFELDKFLGAEAFVFWI